MDHLLSNLPLMVLRQPSESCSTLVIKDHSLYPATQCIHSSYDACLRCSLICHPHRLHTHTAVPISRTVSLVQMPPMERPISCAQSCHPVTGSKRQPLCSGGGCDHATHSLCQCCRFPRLNHDGCSCSWQPAAWLACGQTSASSLDCQDHSLGCNQCLLWHTILEKHHSF